MTNIATHTLKRERAERGSLRRKALEMRNAIDAIELALNGIPDFPGRVDMWEGTRDDLSVRLDMPLGTLRQLGRAYDELNRIINSREYEPDKL